MGRYLALDIGKKRTGLAHSDPLKIIATAIDTIDTHKLLPYLKSYLEKESIDVFVVGLPKKLNNEPSDNAPLVEKWIQLLNQHFPQIEVKTIDERYTSKIAQDVILQSGISKKARQDKTNADKIAAVLILQTFMQQYS